MTSVGIIANPAAGKDIRRIVSQGRFVPNHEKVNILKRVLAGLDAMNVESVIFMPDTGSLGKNALDGAKLSLNPQFVNMPVFHEENDSSRAARAMRESGVGCVITLGGDGTNRAVARECGEVPIMPISTGTNNVFPRMMEGTIAGLAAGAVATGKVNLNEATIRHTRLEVYLDGDLRDIALVDLAVSRERFVGARAIWDISTLHELFLTRAEPTSIGLSAIGARLKRLSPQEEYGLYIQLGEGQTIEAAPVAPGLVQDVEISRWKTIETGGPGVSVDLRPATIALDGERSFSIPQQSEVEVRLSKDGPRVVEPERALAMSITSAPASATGATD